MNENDELELLDLEAELSAMRPAAVAPALLEKVERDFTHSTPQIDRIDFGGNVSRGFFNRYAQPAAAAVLALSSGLLFLATQDDPASPADESPAATTLVRGSAGIGNGFQRVGDRSSVTDPSDGGVRIDEEGKAYRVLEYDVQEEQQWTNPADGTDVKVTRPRREQMMIPLRVF
ncbi:MAG: hypothetical protein ACI9R3_002805 [Verrucomicrobiales bacterium]|jgi:hypothetical protein